MINLSWRDRAEKAEAERDSIAAKLAEAEKKITDREYYAEVGDKALKRQQDEANAATVYIDKLTDLLWRVSEAASGGDAEREEWAVEDAVYDVERLREMLDEARMKQTPE